MKYQLEDLLILGRKLIQESEQMRTPNRDTGSMARANYLSRLGDKLVSVGTPFGVSIEDFSKDEVAFILCELKKVKG
jgi:hypothetical protein